MKKKFNVEEESAQVSFWLNVLIFGGFAIFAITISSIIGEF